MIGLDGKSPPAVTLPAYTIRRLGARVKSGRTAPLSATLDAVLKTDSEESPAAVYNEYVAVQLAQALSLPVASGALVVSMGGHMFASLLLDRTGVSLPTMKSRQVDGVLRRYPKECAAILVFDLWIGNHDRTGNVKACIEQVPVSVFRAFDHEHGLLWCLTSVERSLQALASGDVILSQDHPFVGEVALADATPWLDRVLNLSEEQVHQCCVLGQQLGSVAPREQERLAKALCERRPHLRRLLESVTTWDE